MKLGPLLIVVGIAGMLAAAIVPRLVAPPRDFVCSRDIDGHRYDVALIEDIDDARVLPSGRWVIETEAGFYGYAPLPGELCAVMP